MKKLTGRLFAFLLVFSLLLGMAGAQATAHTENDGHTHEFPAGWVVIRESTCTVQGEERRVCSLCNKVEVRNVLMAPHQWGPETTRVAATCTTEGQQGRICSVCGTADTPRVIPALGHSWGEWALTTAPTCTTQGIETRTCQRCGATETRPVNALGHNYGDTVVHGQPTCTEDSSESQTCTRCGDVKTKVLPKLGHDWGAWVRLKEPTCVEQGEQEHKCNRCGTVEKVPIPALGHKFGEWTLIKEPTCTEKGEEKRVCSVCGTVETRETARLKHVPSKGWYALRKPSLKEPGIKYRVCELCGKRLEQVEYGPKNYHYGMIALNFGPYVKNLKPQELATFEDRFTPLDLHEDGETQWPIITQSGYFIGMVKLNVLQDTVTVTYEMNDPETVVTNEILFLHDDAMSVTAADLNNVGQTLKFGEVISLAGVTEKVLNVRLVVNFDSENQANRPFSDNGLYLDGMTKNADLLQEMTLVLTGASDEVMVNPVP